MQLYPSSTRIANRYEVAGRPLLGGMGIVYLCFDHQEQRPVALKTFKPEFLPERAARQRFLEEGNVWVRLGKHPHIVRCYQVFQDRPRPEVYLALELVAKEEGRLDASLRSRLNPGLPLPVDQALLIALQIARGMRHATETIPGFVHRDLKPENLLVGADHLSDAPLNRVRVTDFGLVKALRDAQAPATAATDPSIAASRLTRVGALLGTPVYMAPERWDGADVGVQADIYALGCILGEMLMGHVLVQGRTQEALRRAHKSGQALAAARLAIPFVMRDLLADCLAVNPGQRYRNWAAVETALAAAYGQIAGRPVPHTQTGAALSRVDRVAAGWSAREIGVSYLDMGNPQAALIYFERARQAGQTEDMPGLQAAGLASLGLAYADLGDAGRAINFLEQALAINRKIGDRRSEAFDLGNLGNAHADLGDARRAIGFFEQALAMRREFGDRLSEGLDLGNLGNAHRQLGDARRAIGFFEQALTIRREFGDRRGESGDLSNMGNAYTDLGDTRRAIGLYEHALAIRREIGDRRGEGVDLGNLGNAYLELGDTRQAIDFYQQALAIRHEIGDRRGEGLDLGNLGEAYRRLGDARRAIDFFEQALAIHREVSNHHDTGGVLGNLGIVYAELGDARQAISFFEQALTIHRDIGDRLSVAMGSFNLAIFHTQHGDPAQALLHAREAARLFTQMGQAAQAERAQQIVAQLERGGRPGAGPSPTEILDGFGPLIDAAVVAAQGNSNARNQLEAIFDMFTMGRWMIADPIHRIWDGERDDTALTAWLDTSDALIVREILRRL